MNVNKAILILSFAGLGFAPAAFAQQTQTTTQQTQTQQTVQPAPAKQGGDRATYSAAKSQADANYKAAKAQCKSLKGVERSNCLGIARAEQRLAKANALSQYKPTDKNLMDARLAAAEVDYTKAKAKCDAIPGNVRETGTEGDVCMSRAAEARNQAIANAKAGRQAAKGDVKAPGSSMDTRGDIGKK